jgi:hypothetical protein
LKSTLRELACANVSWFQLKQPALIDRLHYPLTASTKIWDDTLIDMNRAINEGWVKGELKRIAIGGGCKDDPTLGSIKWLREALVGKRTDVDHADDLVKPFLELQFLRSRFSAHTGGAGAADERTNGGSCSRSTARLSSTLTHLPAGL